MSVRNVVRVVFLVLLASLFGGVVPAMTRFASERYYSTDHTSAIVARMWTEISRGDYYLAGLLNAIPFAVVVALAAGTTAIVPRLRRQMKWMAYALLACVSCFTAASSLAVWNDVYGPRGPHSTACIALIVFPGYATVGVLTVYLAALGAAAVVSLTKRA
jgi:hypothetical protein